MREELLFIVIVASIIVLMVFGFWYAYRRSLRISNPVEVEGEVVEIVPVGRFANPMWNLVGKNKEGDVLYHPVVKFRLDKEKSVRFRNREGFNIGSYEVGQKVKVVYNSANPLEAKIYS